MKHLKKSEGHIGRNVVNIKMKTIVRIHEIKLINNYLVSCNYFYLIIIICFTQSYGFK